MDTAALTEQDREEIRQQLLSWFRLNARDLPWRQTRDPYCIWVSEVMLQQTRVATVIARYTQFIQRFPSLVSLALAREDEVLTMWSGLGYYRRARMLHSAAQLLVNEHGGSLPHTSQELRRLPGVGDYTAAAIASITRNEPVAVMDGNVERVLTRMLGKSAARRAGLAARLKETAGWLLDTKAPGTFNQAMMELGATVCLPRAPQCTACPVEKFCGTKGEHVATPRKQIISRLTHYALVTRPVAGESKRTEVLLVQRPDNASQMPGMWELPALEEAAKSEPVLRIRHAITNTNFYVEVFAVQAEKFLGVGKKRKVERHDWILESKLGEIPLTGLARKILMRLDVMAKPREVRSGKALPARAGDFL
ncbi:MAG: A/G-specific adenine glycosylase [Acidobacteriaceae bacterium]